MIQSARSPNSTSLLRELEFMTLLVQNDKDRNYFLEKLNEIYNKRNESMGAKYIKTGAKAFKVELLRYLQTKGFVETANIWARALPYDEKAINNLLLTLQNQLIKQGIEGVLEVHLQDREINSPHIQFVGNNADRAEQIIAAILVKMKYEIDMENALGKKHFVPYYQINEKASYPKHNDLKDTIEYYKNLSSAEANMEHIKASLDKIDDITNALKQKIERFKETKQEKSLLETRLQELMNETISQSMQFTIKQRKDIAPQKSDSRKIDRNIKQHRIERLRRLKHKKRRRR